MRHPSDPAKLHQAAATLGRSVAEGGCSLADARLLCATMAELSPASADRGGLQARLCWTAEDTATAHAKAIWRAEDGLRDAVRPMIDRRESKAAIEEAAGAYADALTWPRIFTILRDEVARARFKARWR